MTEIESDLTELEKQYDRISEAAHALRTARLTLEEEAKRQTELALEEKIMALAEAVRKAYGMVANKSAILRAMHTKDRGTLDRYLAMTAEGTFVAPSATQEELAPTPKGGPSFYYDQDQGILGVELDGHVAEFTVDVWDDGGIYLWSQVNLWSANYSERNEVVFLLDGKNIALKENELAAALLPYLRERI